MCLRVRACVHIGTRALVCYKRIYRVIEGRHGSLVRHSTSSCSIGICSSSIGVVVRVSISSSICVRIV